MQAAPLAPAAPDPVRAIAAQLTDIAGALARDAEAATAIVRGMTDEAREMAELAASLEHAANLMDGTVRHQAEILAHARQSASANKPAIDALAQSIESVAAISRTIAGIARQSRVLGLNARIEASRSAAGASGFVAVAQELTTLAGQTKHATDDIASRSDVIERDIRAARDIVASHDQLLGTQETILADTLEHAGQHRDSASALAAITTRVGQTIDQAACAIGRLGASATAVRILARQVTRLIA